MVVRDFLARVQDHPALELVYSDPTMCIIRCLDEGVGRKVRLGLWAVRRMQWEQIATAFGLPGPPGR